MSYRCVGRRTAQVDVIFENGPRLHKKKPLLFLLPRRCSTSVNAHHTLCQECDERRVATEKQLVKRAGKYIPNQSSMLHGVIHEDIPKWSRIYRGPWWEEQIQKGYTLSEDVQMEADKADRLAKEEDIIIDMPPKKSTKEVKPAPAPPKKTAPVVEEVARPAAPSKKFVFKSKTNQIGIICPTTDPFEPIIITIPVRPIEINGRSLYLGPNDKVFDTKFHYIGRYNEGVIDTTYPDSDG